MDISVILSYSPDRTACRCPCRIPDSLCVFGLHQDRVSRVWPDPCRYLSSHCTSRFLTCPLMKTVPPDTWMTVRGILYRNI